MPSILSLRTCQRLELNSIMTKKELLVVVYSLKKFRHYIIGY